MDPDEEAALVADAERHGMTLIDWPDGTTSVYEPKGPKPFFSTRREALKYVANRMGQNRIFEG